MGKLEKELRVEIRKSKVTRAIITLAAVPGGLALDMLAPRVLGAAFKGNYVRQNKYRVKSSLSRLITKGYLRLEAEDSKRRIRLTPKGDRYAALLGEGKLVPKKPKHWDKKWRLLIFDIPERRRRTRRLLRQTLQNLGLVRLQDSVWIYPYDCEDLVTLLKADLKIGKDLLYVIADKIEYDLPLRKQFGLM